MPLASMTCEAKPAMSRCLQRLVEIGDEVGGILDPDREPHQPVIDAQRGAVFGLQAMMRRRRRMRDEALGVAEIVGNLDQSERVLEAEGAGLAAGHRDSSKVPPPLICRRASSCCGWLS